MDNRPIHNRPTPLPPKSVFGIFFRIFYGGFRDGFAYADEGVQRKLHDRGKGEKTPEKAIKARSGAYHGIFTSFPAFHSLHSPLCASFQDSESPVKLPVKIRIKFKHTLRRHDLIRKHQLQTTYDPKKKPSPRLRKNEIRDKIIEFLSAPRTSRLSTTNR